METITKPTFFNRHESMNSETRSAIMDLITDLTITENCNPHAVINMLYGSFDGYDYSDEILAQHILINSLNDGGNTGLVNQILSVAATISKYPRTEQPNGNQF